MANSLGESVLAIAGWITRLTASVIATILAAIPATSRSDEGRIPIRQTPAAIVANGIRAVANQWPLTAARSAGGNPAARIPNCASIQLSGAGQWNSNAQPI